MDKFLNTKYSLVRTDDNYETYLTAIGLSAEQIKLTKTVTSTTQLVKLGANEYSTNVIFGSKTLETKFVLGQETERTTLDGRTVKSTFTIEGNKLVERQIEADREVTTIREFTDDELVIEFVVGDIRSKIYLKPVVE